MDRSQHSSAGAVDAKRSTRLVRFFVSGGSAAGLYFVFAYGSLRLGLEPAMAGLLAYALAFGIGYGLQQRWTFSGRHRHARALPRYFALQALCALLSAGILRLGTGLGVASPLVVSLASTLVLGLVSYLISSLWVFADE